MSLDMTLIEQIQQLILTDGEDQSDRLQYYYESQPIERQGAIDEVFIFLCGYSLQTIIAGDAI